MSYGKGVGYSEKINRPEFQKFKPKNLSAISLLALFLAPVVMLIFVVLAITGKLGWSIALILGGLCGLLLIVLYYWTSSHKKEVKTMDGVLIKKKRLRKKGTTDDKDVIFLLVFEMADGSERKINVTKLKPLFKYYQVGDLVRFHPGLTYPEKQKKLFDDKIVCVSCGKLTDAIRDKCCNCHLPLLK